MLFICFLNWTEQGAKTVKGVPARHENLKAEIAQLGGRLVGGYVTRGQYDVVFVLEMPNGDAMTKLTVALISRGNVRTTTVRAHSMEEKARGRGNLSKPSSYPRTDVKFASGLNIDPRSDYSPRLGDRIPYLTDRLKPWPYRHERWGHFVGEGKPERRTST